ncbi:MAG: SDR family NAD(P)-dependent oxidoreductase [Candidatus Lokiarchaeota archaeon]|nr:SDR family NAD(P)-dependent oxidoreductase [Candidatus Lokiarchaeota archaeon]
MNDKANFMSWDNPGVALITGASAGIGAEFARQLAEQGFDLILLARRKKKLDNLSRELKKTYSVDAEVFVADLSKLDNNYKIVSKILNLDNLDVLVNNAGYGINKSFLETDIGQYIGMINVHFTSAVMFCHAAIPNMVKRKRGVIINTSSTAAVNKAQGSVMYTSTKTALTVFSELLQEKIKDTSIIIQSLCPGYTYSEFHDTESMRGFQRSWFPKESWMEAEEVVGISLEAVKSKEVIVVPGELNQNNVRRIRKVNVERYLAGKRL